MDTEKYSAECFCINCGFQGPVDIPVGIPVIRDEVKCPVCQVGYQLRPVAFRDWKREESEARG